MSAAGSRCCPRRELGDGVAVPRRIGTVVRDQNVLRAADLVEALLPLGGVLEIAIRNQDVHRRLPVLVGIPVAGHVLPRLARGVDERERLACLAPHRLGRELHVGDLDGHARAAADLDRLGPCGEHVVLLVADVARVEAAVGLDHRGERRQLVDRAVEAGVVFESAREPDRAVLHRAVDERLHRLDLGRRRGTLEVAAQDNAADRAVADAGHDVDGRVNARVALEEVGDRQVAAAILADERQRDALLDLARGVRVIFETAIRVAVHVDEAGRDHAAGRVDDRVAWLRRQVGADLDDRVAGYPHVGGSARGAGAIDDACRP